jgi:integrase/recombinase XerD
MTASPELPELLQGFFTRRLIAQRNVSPNTLASYRDTFRLLFQYAEKQLRRPPSSLTLGDLNAEFIGGFLDMVERERGNATRTRNLRLTAIRSFFRYAALEAPQNAGLIQRVLAIPSKRYCRKIVGFLTQTEVGAILSTVDQSTWCGQRDHALLLTMMQTGLRLAEITGLHRQDAVLGVGAHVRCQGKGRKERCTPITKSTARTMRAWLKRQNGNGDDYLFPSARGGRLSHDAVQDVVAKHVAVAQRKCTSLANRRITPHMLRHTAAMELLQAGIDRSLIAIWLGHESVDTTQIYLDANLSLKEQILAQSRQPNAKTRRFRPSDRLLDFLRNL